MTTDPSVTAVGPKDLVANLEQQLHVSQPQIKHPKVSCPAFHRYPLACHLTGTARINATNGPVAGTLTVIGVSTGTHTYAFTTQYAPAR